jgi:hypothetical protein
MAFIDSVLEADRLTGGHRASSGTQRGGFIGEF